MLYLSIQRLRRSAMITNIRIDLSEIKEILFKVINKNASLLTADSSTILQALYEEYSHKNTINIDELDKCKNVFSDYYAEKCRSFSIIDDTNENNYSMQKLNSLIDQGKVIDSQTLLSFKTQLIFENELLNEKNEVAVSIITNLLNYLGKSYFNYNALETLFRYAIMLYLSSSHSINCSSDTETMWIITSMKNLLNTFDIDYKIEYGDIYLSDESEALIHRDIEKTISYIGGINFLQMLFDKEITPKYAPTIDRYLIHRDKQQQLSKVTEIRIPYNYLIQIAVKHLNENGNALLTAYGKMHAYNHIIRISSDYLNILNLQKYYIYEDLNYDYREIPVKLAKNILFEKLFTPIQYRPDFIIRFIQDMYHPFFSRIKNIEYTHNDYMKLCKALLFDNKVCTSYTFNELKNKSGLKHSVLKNILRDISTEYYDANSSFNSFLSQTNYTQKPLVRLQNGKYFFLSPHFNSFAFSEVLYNKLNSQFEGTFNREKGIYFEKMIKSLLDKKDFTYHCGKYTVENSISYECDMVLEDDNTIVFIELKNQPLPQSFEQGDDVETLRCLGEGMVKAQLQCFRHVKYLKKKGSIVLTTKKPRGHFCDYILNYNNRRIYCISICSQEYLFLTDCLFSQRFMQSLLISTYHAFDDTKEHSLDRLNSLQKRLENIVYDIYGDDYRISQVFHNTLFRTAQQLYVTLHNSNSLDDFIDFLTTPTRTIFGGGDAYCQILLKHNLDNSD